MARAAAGTARGAAAAIATHREFTPRKAGAIAAKAPRVATALTGRAGADPGKSAGDEAARHDRRKRTVSRTVAREDAAAQRKGLADERLTQRRAKGHSFFESDELWTDARIGRKDQSTRLPRLSR